MWKYVHEGI